MLHKQQSRAFGKDVYLLGHDAYKTNYWLEAPTWDTHAWSFGYVENYSNNRRPSAAKHVTCHQHYKHLWLARHYLRLTDWQGFQSPLLADEQWALSDLMKQAYLLSNVADLFKDGHMYISGKPMAQAGLKDETLVARINSVMLPAVFAKMKELLI